MERIKGMIDFYQQPKIGIVGLGFVGNAVKSAYENTLAKLVLKDPAKGHIPLYTELLDCDAIFICVPSPSLPNGSCDTSILESALLDIIGFKGVIISKVTAPPNVYEGLQILYPNLVHVPEFLVAATATRDYVSEENVIIGGSIQAYKHEAFNILKIGQANLKNAAYTTIGEAALAKYIVNSFLATKVVFMNEMYQLATKLGYDWRMIRMLIDIDKRIGNSHTQVPGPDGQLGFGGGCFPKDTQAIINFANELEIDLNVLKSAVKKNTLIRLGDTNGS